MTYKAFFIQHPFLSKNWMSGYYLSNSCTAELSPPESASPHVTTVPSFFTAANATSLYEQSSLFVFVIIPLSTCWLAPAGFLRFRMPSYVFLEMLTGTCWHTNKPLCHCGMRHDDMRVQSYEAKTAKKCYAYCTQVMISHNTGNENCDHCTYDTHGVRPTAHLINRSRLHIQIATIAHTTHMG